MLDVLPRAFSEGNVDELITAGHRGKRGGLTAGKKTMLGTVMHQVGAPRLNKGVE